MIVLFIVIIEVFFYVNLLVWIMNIGNNWIFWDYVILYVNFLYLKILKFNYNNLVWWFWIVVNIFILNIGFRFEK